MKEIPQNILSKSSEFRLVALWALSESALGGILHALRLPFTGLVVGGFSIVFISLLANISASKKNILSAMLVVMLIKFSISPHTPFTAYLAVSLQGLLGYLLFTFIPSKMIAAVTLGVTTQLLSAFQRLITITIVFGTEFWAAIDSFSSAIINKFYTSSESGFDVSVSLILIMIYALIHIMGGIYFGRLGYLLPKLLGKNIPENINEKIRAIEIKKNTKSKKKWYRRKMPRLLFTILILASILTYIFPVAKEEDFLKVVYMILRAILIISIWVLVVSPLIMRAIKLYFKKKTGEYQKALESSIKLLPLLKRVVVYSYSETKKYPGLMTRVKEFIVLTFSIALLIELEAD